MNTIAITVSILLLAFPALAGESPSPTGTQSFYMGFTGFVYDYTPGAVEATHKFVRENGDILCHHIEGVPWKESLSGEPFPDALLKEWKDKRTAAAPGMKIYMTIPPELFKAWRDCGLLDQDGKTRPAYWVWKSYFDLPRK